MQKLTGWARQWVIRLFSGVVLAAMTANLIAVPLPTTVAQAAGTACVTSGPAGGAYTVTPCITAPASGATFVGSQTISATYSTTGANPGVAKLIFYLGGVYLITDYAAPYTFTLPSAKFKDGTYTLEVEALMKDGFTSQRASISIILSNGNTKTPVNTNTFTPTSGTTPASGQPYVLAVAGDGADGAANASSVTDLINSWNPNLFLYVGDVYENGTATEFYNWYGAGSVFYGRFRAVTDPVVGNHEYTAGVAPGYFDYWNNVPSYYSYDANGWHFIALNSNCGLLNNCQPGQAEYNWLQNDLNTHANQCTIAYAHHPPFNVGPEGYTTTMNAMWSLMAQHGVDIMLTGHDHDYQRWKPLNGSGQVSPTGITEFVTGTGGHGIQQFITTDNRMAIGYDTSPFSFGALRLELNHDGASFQFVNSQGLLLDSGSIPCSGAPADVTAPGVPGSLLASPRSSNQADLSWTGSTDNVGVSAYDIYRNGALLTSVGLTTRYTDNNLTPGTAYTYQVKARDAANNTSAFSNSASVTMQSLLFGDGFESGAMGLWTNAGIAVQQQERYEGAYAARMTSTGSVAASAARTLSSSQSDLYYSLRFKVLSLGSTSAYLQRFRTATNGAIAAVFISGSSGKLGYRNDVTAASVTNGPVVTPGAWHQLQTHLTINGASSVVEVYYDGALVPALSSTSQSLGTNPIGKIQLGDTTATDVYDIALDNVGVNTSYVDDSDTTAPSTPAGLAANATAPNSVSLNWNAATDNVSVAGYDVYRNGALAASLGIVTSYTDTPVSPNFAYQYQVLARDGSGNTSPLSSAASVTTPADTSAPSVTITSPTDAQTVNGSIVVRADATDDVGVDHVDFLMNGTLVTSVGEGGPYEFLWDSTTVPDGTTEAISAVAVDASGNPATSNTVTVTVNNGGGDTLPPSVPGSVTATAGGASRVDVTWSASTDNFGVTGYDVYRNATLLTSLGAVTTYSDSTVSQGATYQYQVLARDAAGNSSALSTASSVTVPAPLFGDGFESGDLSQWSNNGLTVQQQAVLDGAYAARGTSNGTAATYAFRQLSVAQTNLYYSTWFKLLSQGATSAYLQRFRTGANGAILGVFVSSTGKLGYRNDVAATTTTSTTSVSQNVWHQLQTHVNINGASSLVEVWLDGAPIALLSKTDSLGANPIGRVQLGDSQGTDVFDIALDNVGYDTSYLQPATAPNTTIDNGPLGTVNSSAASFSFSSSTAGATFECSLDAAAFAACTSPQSLSGLADGSHTFAARAIDTLGNPDPTPASRSWNIDTTAPTVTSMSPADSATGVAITASVSAAFSEAMAPASLTTSSFTLVSQADLTQVSVTGSYDSATNTAMLQPSAPLAYSTTYTATVMAGAGGATDAAGNPLAADASWSFTTLAQDVTAPTVTVTAPAEGAAVGGPAVTLSADATDDFGVAHVDFLVNGTVVGTDATAPYSINWDASAMPNGAAVVTAQGVDTSGNPGASAPVNVTISNDVTPPSVPTGLSANAPSGSRVDLAWTASTDDVGVTAYDMFRDGAPLASVGAVTAYSDTTVGPSKTYQYQVRARDAAGNASALSTAAPATTTDVLFRDRFETGDLSRWTTVNGLGVQAAEVYAGSFAARATTSGPVANAFYDFGASQYDLYFDVHVKMLSQDPSSSIYIMRFRKADTLSAVGVFISPTGKLGYRNDIAGVANTSTASVSAGAWHEVQAHVRIDPAGGPGLVETWLDGTQVQSQAEPLSNAPVTRLQLGDSTVGRTYDFAYDDALVASFYVNPGDTQAPTAPVTVNASASAANIVDLTWSAATDDVGVTGYSVYRNGAMIAYLGNVLAYNDTTAIPSTSYQYTVSARDAAENISALSAPASVTTPADSVPPTVSLTSPVNGAHLGGTVTLSATASDNIGLARVEFLANSTIVGTVTTSPYNFSWNSASIPDGAYTITARAVDLAGNPATSAVSVTVDNTPPDTTITAKPAALTTSSSASFSFTSNEAGVTFQCSLDNIVFSACTSPKAYTGLSSAAHTFQVQAMDAAGNTDPTPASYAWTVDTIAPSMVSASPASRSTNISPATSVVVVFSEPLNPATVTTSTFTLKVNRGSTVASTVTYNSATNTATLKPNANLATNTTYVVTLTGIKDIAGNALSTNWSFTTGILDTTPPTVTLTAPTTGAFVKGSVTLSATASDVGSGVASVAFLVNGAVVGTDTSSPYSFAWNSASVADGSVTIAARATDIQNNITTTAAITVTVDNTVPDTTITSGPTGTVTVSTASFSFTSNEASVTFQCSLDSTSSYSACTSPASYSGLTNATHTFRVRAVDRAGNIDATPASQSWTVNAPVAPDTSITAGPTGFVKTTSASFSFTATIGGSTFQCSLDGAAFAACTSPKALSALANGSHTFQVKATSPGGITDPTPASRTWTVDTVAPTGVAITAPANGATVSGQVTINASASDNNGVASVTFYVDGQSLATDSSAPYSTTWNTNKVKSGNHTIYAIATDAAGNTTQSATITVKK